MNKRKLFNRMGFPGQLGKLGDVLCGFERDLSGIKKTMDTVGEKADTAAAACTEVAKQEERIEALEKAVKRLEEA